MKSTARMTAEDRRQAIVRAATAVFVEKGFRGTTTRQLAEAAGVSEALLFKHFPSKEALYAAILTTCFDKESARIGRQLRLVKPSTEALVLLVEDLVSHILGGDADERKLAFFRLVVRSLLDEGEFTRWAIQGGPTQWVRKVHECVDAAREAGDLVERPVQQPLAGWFVHQLIVGLMLHILPDEPVVDYGVSREELIKQAVRFCLRGMGLSEQAIARYCS